jgi:signal transduction histidine kinase
MGLSSDFESLPEQTGKYPVENKPRAKLNNALDSSSHGWSGNLDENHHSRQGLFDQTIRTNQIEDNIQSDDSAKLLELARQLLDSLEFDANFQLRQIKKLIPFEAAILFRHETQSLIPMGFYQQAKSDGFTYPAISILNTEAFESVWKRQSVFLMNSEEKKSGLQSLMKGILEVDLQDVLDKMQTQLWVPLIKNDHIVGLLGLGHSQRNAFEDRHSELIVKIAHLVVNALANSERFAQVQASAAQEERRGLARNLHDAVNQSLFSAGLIAEVLPHVWAKDPEEGKKSLEDLRRLTRGAQAEIRMMLVELRHSKLIDVEIADLLHLLANAFTGRTNIPVVEDIQKENSLPSNIQTAFYQFCQEALNNTVKHSQATQVHIVYRRKGPTYVLCVKDNGCGFDRRRKGMRRDRKIFSPEIREKNFGFNPKHIPPGHYGLRMMDELASSVGAELRIETRPGQGTSVSIRWKKTPTEEGIQE